jgi:cytoskeletal protein CcmA (bactofilin family)
MVILPTVLANYQNNDIKTAGASINIITEDATNIYAAGARVDIEGKVKQNIWAAGALINIDTDTNGNLHAAGSRLNIKGKVNGKVRLAGADIKLDAIVGGGLKAAAASINISEEAKLSSETSLTAAMIEFNGTAKDNIRLYADEVTFSGKASGSVTIEGRDIQIDDTAQIDGDLIIRSSKEVVISPNTRIIGEITKTGLEDSNGRGGFFLILSTSIFLLGLILIFFLRDFVEQEIKTLRTQPGRSLLWGLAVFFGIPLFFVIAMITIIGIPIGVATLLLLPFLLILSFTTATLGVSDWLFNRNNATKKTGQRILLLIGGVILFIIIGFLPFLGGLLIFLAMLFGLGASSATIGRYISAKTV